MLTIPNFLNWRALDLGVIGSLILLQLVCSVIGEACLSGRERFVPHWAGVAVLDVDGGMCFSRCSNRCVMGLDIWTRLFLRMATAREFRVRLGRPNGAFVGFAAWMWFTAREMRSGDDALDPCTFC